MSLSLDYIAGLIDADGSFSISLALGSAKTTIGVHWVVNFRQIHRDIVEQVCETLQCGRVYYSHRNKENRLGIWSWQTTRQNDSLQVAKTLLPHLHIKQGQCKKFIETLELWLSYNENTQLNGKRKCGKVLRPRSVLQKVFEAYLSMNDCVQTQTARKNKIKRIEAIEHRISEYTM